MKRWLSSSMILLAVIAIALGTSGCAAAKKKFTRKSTAGPTRPVVYTEKEYIKPYTNEYYYTNNYNLWKVWQEELVHSSGGNAKHSTRSVQEAIARLKEMQSYLEEPKHSELGGQIAQIERAAVDIERGNVSEAQSGQSTFVLEKTLRVIKANFYTDDVKPWIKKDEIKL